MLTMQDLPCMHYTRARKDGYSVLCNSRTALDFIILVKVHQGNRVNNNNKDVKSKEIFFCSTGCLGLLEDIVPMSIIRK